MALLREQMSNLGLLAELEDPAPILEGIRKLVPNYTGDPLNQGQSKLPVI